MAWIYLAELEPVTFANDGSYLPTPEASAWRDWNNTKTHGRHTPRYPIQIYQKTGKRVSINFLEWMMGYPSQWTALDVSVTQWFRSKQKQLLKDYYEGENKP